MKVKRSSLTAAAHALPAQSKGISIRAEAENFNWIYLPMLHLLNISKMFPSFPARAFDCVFSPALLLFTNLKN